VPFREPDSVAGQVESIQLSYDALICNVSIDGYIFIPEMKIS
jgi:hypothetical protein